MATQRPATCFLLFTLLAAIPAAAENAAIPFARFAAFQAAFKAIPPQQRDKLMFVLQLAHSDKSNHQQIHAWADADGVRTDIQVAADGTLQLPDRPAWAAQGVLLQTDQPRYSLEIGLDMLVAPPPGETIKVGYLLDAVQQANAAMRAGARQIGGYLAMLVAPTSKSVVFVLAGCCDGTATLQGAAPPIIVRQAKSGDIVIPIEQLREAENGTIKLSAPAARIGLFSDN